MRMFSRIRLRKLINEFLVQCILHPQYSVGVFLTSNNHMNTVYREIIKSMPQNEIEKEYHSIENQIRIKLTNGSSIDIFSGITYGCMRRYSTLIYDKSLNHDYINTVIRCLALTKRLYKVQF